MGIVGIEGRNKAVVLLQDMIVAWMVGIHGQVEHDIAVSYTTFIHSSRSILTYLFGKYRNEYT